MRIQSLRDLRKISGRKVRVCSETAGYCNPNMITKMEDTFNDLTISSIMRYMHAVGAERFEFFIEEEKPDEIVEYLIEPKISNTGADYLLREFFEMHNLTQQEMADRLGCSRPTISVFFKEENPRPRYIAKVVKGTLGMRFFMRFFMKGQPYELEFLPKESSTSNAE